MTHPIVTDEETLLEGVRTLLEEEPWQVPAREKDIVEELQRLRDEMVGAKAEDLGSLRAQFDANHSLLRQIRETRDRPQVDPASPYFAHLRLLEDGRSRDIFLGKATRISRGIRIVDWRHAPVSRIFYQYQQGEVYEEQLGDRLVEGEVTARRTLTIRSGELLRVDAPEGVFRKEDDGWTQASREPARLAGGAGAALRAHAAGDGSDRRMGTDLQGHRRRADKRLPDIAGLIDPAQFELISQPSSGYVVIRGTAGSGKTTVALHRIAYLAYQDPVFDSPATLFMVFSPALKDYVSHVLPALGVHRAQVQDFRSWAAAQRKRHFPRLPRHHRHDTPTNVVRIKLHPATMRALEDQVRSVPGPRNGEQAFDDWTSTVTRAEPLFHHLEQLSPGAFTFDEVRKACEWNHDRIEEMIAWMEGDKEIEAALDVEDDPLLLRAWQLRAGPLRHKKKSNLRFRHIAVDEVQDFSPLEVRVLLDCLDRNKSITLAGDTQQHVMKDAGFTSWSDFFQHLGLPGTHVNTLKIAYRSSRPIVSFAMGLLGELREDDDMPLVTRDGPAVELFRFTDHGACVAFLADALKALQEAEPLASVALLTGDPSVTGLYYDGLKRGEVPRLRRVVQQAFTFAPGIEITEVEQVKGLEFDYVVLVEVSAGVFPDTDGARRVLHVGATRAVHQLWVTSVGAPSPMIEQALKAT